jgi:hypothetical protein
LLTDYIIEHTEKSEIVKAQKKTPSINVLSGTKFDASSDEEKQEEAKNYIKSLDEQGKANLYRMVLFSNNSEEDNKSSFSMPNIPSIPDLPSSIPGASIPTTKPSGTVGVTQDATKPSVPTTEKPTTPTPSTTIPVETTVPTTNEETSTEQDTTVPVTTTTPAVTTTPAITTPEKPEYSEGDVNGDKAINANDASMILAEYAIIATNGTRKFTEEQLKFADVNGDGDVNAIDASWVLGYYAYISTGGTMSLKDYISILS